MRRAATSSHLDQEILDVLYAGSALIWFHCLHFTYSNALLLQKSPHRDNVGVADVIVQLVVGRQSQKRFSAVCVLHITINDFQFNLRLNAAMSTGGTFGS